MDFDPNRPSDVPVDIVTPMVAKDVRVFRETAKLLRRNLLHPIGQHYVVAPQEDSIRKACNDLGCVFIDESDVAPVPFSVLQAAYATFGRDRSGWLFQQFLKLNADSFTTAENILVIDSDTAFVRPVRLELNGKWIFDVTHGYEASYDESIRRLLGVSAPLPYSYVVHFMVFNVSVLRSMRNDIERRLAKPWTEAIVDTLDLENFLCFSEWNLYANYALRKGRLPYTNGFWFNREGNLDRTLDVTPQIESLSANAKTVSFHFYKRKRIEISS